MTKEEKINVLPGFLAPLLFEGRNEGPNGPDEPVRITFPSTDRVEYPDLQGLGTTQVVTFIGMNPLHGRLEQIVNYGITAEREHWERCVREQREAEEELEAMDDDIVYDKKLIANHIYHSLCFCKELIEGYP
jgi:hypothetical protein